MPSLLKKAGEQGFIGASVPEEYGGLGKDFVTSTLLMKVLERGYSFSVAMTRTYRYWYYCLFYILEQKNKRKNIFQT